MDGLELYQEMSEARKMKRKRHYSLEKVLQCFFFVFLVPYVTFQGYQLLFSAAKLVLLSTIPFVEQCLAYVSTLEPVYSYNFSCPVQESGSGCTIYIFKEVLLILLTLKLSKP